MSPFEKLQKAAALKYADTSPEGAPLVVASGMGFIAREIVDAAERNGVPVFRDDSLATLLSRMEAGTSIPPELYQAIVDIYVYFLGFSVDSRGNVTRTDPEAPARAPGGAADDAPGESDEWVGLSSDSEGNLFPAAPGRSGEETK